jgi:hypothetical protein
LAVSNYLYGASGINFVPYLAGTVLGFLPGTFAYVYAGCVGKALTIDNNMNIMNNNNINNSGAASMSLSSTLSSTTTITEPWYIYLGGMVVVLVLLKIAGDVASDVIESLKDEQQQYDDRNDFEGRWYHEMIGVEVKSVFDMTQNLTIIWQDGIDKSHIKLALFLLSYIVILLFVAN